LDVDLQLARLVDGRIEQGKETLEVVSALPIRDFLHRVFIG
jgi:hypothetical protein